MGAGAVKSEITGKFTIEAGALVMANKGILLVDELDKMQPEDMASLHESMESCTVTKTIVGQNRSFNAETTIIAACNPKTGRFDDADPLTKQISLPPALLSRFDAIFVMRDKPDATKDRAILTRIYKNYAKPETLNPPVPPELLRKYIIYAKRITPQFTHSQDVEDTLADFYVGLRNTSSTTYGIPTISIAARHAESILRFAEASARIRLCEQVEKQDIERAIQIILGYLKEFGLDPLTGKIDIDRIGSDVPASSRNIAKAILDTLADKSTLSYELIFNKLKETMPNIKENDMDEVLSKLQHNGDITEPRKGYYLAM
jgi:replicative DNA helicase Mcm